MNKKIIEEFFNIILNNEVTTFLCICCKHTPYAFVIFLLKNYRFLYKLQPFETLYQFKKKKSLNFQVHIKV